jgi:outer membrane receptor for ferrienterochelin and colicins
MKITLCACLFASIIIFDANRVLAQDQKPPRELTDASLEDLKNVEVKSVYSASKFLQKVTDAPSSVSVVTANEIKKYGYRTLADILRSVHGFYVTYDRNYSYIGVRGFARPGDYNTRVLLLIDGHRLNDNIYDLALLGTELPIDMDLIDRIEIIRGPSSSLYGTSAFFAVINIIIKKGEDVRRAEFSIEGASFRTYKGRFSYGHKFGNDLDMLISGSYYDSHGPRRLYIKEFNDPSTNHGIAENVDDDRANKFYGGLTYHDFGLRGVYGSREKGIPTGAFNTFFNDSRTRTIDRRGYIDFQYQRFFSNQLELLARASFDSYHYDGAYVNDRSDSSIPQLTINKDFSRGESWSGELQLTKVLLLNHKATIGGEYRDNLRQNQANYDLAPHFQYIDDRRRSRNSAFYLQDQYAIRENVTLNAGVRLDKNSRFGTTIKPRLGLIYHPTQKTSLKFLYGEAYRAPNSYELYYYGSESNKANLNLKPENIKTGELVMEQYLGDHVRLSASTYIYRINGLISQQTDPNDGLITFNNAEKIESKGFEVDIETKLANGLEGRIGYTLQDTRNQQIQQSLSNSPKHLGKFNLIVPLVKQKVFTSLELQYTSRRKTLAGGNTEAFCLSNFTFFGQKLAKGLDLTFSVYNLFDQKYGDPGAEEHRQDIIEQNGRNVRLKLTYRF